MDAIIESYICDKFISTDHPIGSGIKPLNFRTAQPWGLATGVFGPIMGAAPPSN